ncbi:MAG: amidohydrolase family protein [Lentisphaeria bacterium]|nr:amidohydrolase family protein [Lentisphaeria bacterium]
MKEAIWEKKGSLAEQLWNTGKLDFPIYDMHGHMGPAYGIYFQNCMPADMVAHMKRIGIKHLVFSHHETLTGFKPNPEVVEICREYPEHLRMYAGIIPQRTEEIKRDLALFDSWKPYAVGLKILPIYHNHKLSDKEYDYALSFADERALPVLIHTWGNAPECGIYETLCKYPNAKFFLAHCCFGAWEYAERCVKETHNNVWLELTAVPGERGIIEKLVGMVGSEKILFGTDLPWFDEYQAVGGVLSADITEDDMRNILYRNVENILGKDW